MKPLIIPPAAQRDDHAIQMVSAWIAEHGLHCSLNIGMWNAQGKDEASAWGILVADLIRHVANAMQDQTGISAESAMSRLLHSLHRELDEPTSAVSGGFHPGHS